ncbi:hypothetical protein P7K49_016788 [Saguinus oedipus]|uniref:Uncharacterized protein n=1 Tax=Saguinus oedipus TaxID=9490 RepID=A0ABQ9VEF1_SAGOE|nr:hypothetical protein P7K49_016788 [Saguinus oedipus]
MAVRGGLARCQRGAASLPGTIRPVSDSDTADPQRSDWSRGPGGPESPARLSSPPSHYPGLLRRGPTGRAGRVRASVAGAQPPRASLPSWLGDSILPAFGGQGPPRPPHWLPREPPSGSGGAWLVSDRSQALRDSESADTTFAEPPGTF